MNAEFRWHYISVRSIVTFIKNSGKKRVSQTDPIRIINSSQ